MVLSREDDRTAQPYWYARVIGVFHAHVSCSHRKSPQKTMESMPFLWVRWLGAAPPPYKAGPAHARLPKVGFVPWNKDFDNYSFGFLDPAEVLRGAHLIPAFHDGRTNTLLPHDCAVARQVKNRDGKPVSTTDDWENYYVNVYVHLIVILTRGTTNF